MNASTPRRKGFAVTSLILGILGLPTLGLAGIGAMLGVVFGVVALVKARNAPAEYEGTGLAITGIALSVVSILLIPFIGIIAAIAIPSLLRARIAANEAAAIGDIRSVLSAEVAYASANGGYYGELQCLGKPADCIPGYSGPPMLDDALAKADVKHGYKRSFHAGQQPAPGAASRSRLKSFAYVANPAQSGQTGNRSFCGDSAGQVCFKLEAFDDVSAACPADCRPLR